MSPDELKAYLQNIFPLSPEHWANIVEDVWTKKKLLIDPHYRGDRADYWAIMLALLACRLDIPHIGHQVSRSLSISLAGSVRVAHDFNQPMRAQDATQLSKVFAQVAPYDPGQALPHILFTSNLNKSWDLLAEAQGDITNRPFLEKIGQSVILIQVPTLRGWQEINLDDLGDQVQLITGAYQQANSEFQNSEGLKTRPNEKKSETIHFQVGDQAYKCEQAYAEGDIDFNQKKFFRKIDPRPNIDSIGLLIPQIMLALMVGAHQVYEINTPTAIHDQYKDEKYKPAVFGLKTMAYNGSVPELNEQALFSVRGTSWSDLFLNSAQDKIVYRAMAAIQLAFGLDENLLDPEAYDPGHYKNDHLKWLKTSLSYLMAVDYLTRPDQKRYHKIQQTMDKLPEPGM